MKKPNVLWICTDQQRWDTIAAMGNPHIRTPNLDRLCSLGIAYERAYCQSPICAPSRASFMTGRYPASTHVFRNNAGPFPESEVLAARVFREAGYHTGLIGKLHLSNARWAERRPDDDGYEEFHWSHMGGRSPKSMAGVSSAHDDDAFCRWLERQGISVAELRRESPLVIGDGFPAELNQNHWMGEMAVDFVQRHHERPWMLSLHPYDPHHPFDPAPEYHRRYDYRTLPHARFAEHEFDYQARYERIDQQRPIPVSPDGRCKHPGGPNNHRICKEWPTLRVPEPYDSRIIKAAYYAKIEQIDFEIGRIIDALERNGQLSDTIIVFHSDHGEFLGDHGLLYKGCRFYDALVRVPLIISYPKKIAAGRRHAELVELVDILPTILELSGLAVPAWVQGKSLLPLLDGRADQHRRVVTSHFYDAIALYDHTHATMSFDGRYKLTTYHGHDDLIELFDLQEDPDEFHNIWSQTDPADLVRLLTQHNDAIASTISVGNAIVRRANFEEYIRGHNWYR